MAGSNTSLEQLKNHCCFVVDGMAFKSYIEIWEACIKKRSLGSLLTTFTPLEKDQSERPRTCATSSKPV